MEISIVHTSDLVIIYGHDRMPSLWIEWVAACGFFLINVTETIDPSPVDDIDRGFSSGDLLDQSAQYLKISSTWSGVTRIRQPPTVGYQGWIGAVARRGHRTQSAVVGQIGAKDKAAPKTLEFHQIEWCLIYIPAADCSWRISWSRSNTGLVSRPAAARTSFKSFSLRAR